MYCKCDQPLLLADLFQRFPPIHPLFIVDLWEPLKQDMSFSIIIHLAFSASACFPYASVYYIVLQNKRLESSLCTYKTNCDCMIPVRIHTEVPFYEIFINIFMVDICFLSLSKLWKLWRFFLNHLQYIKTWALWFPSYNSVSLRICSPFS